MVKLYRRAGKIPSTFRVQCSHNVFNLDRFVRQRSARALSGRLFNLPTVRDESKEAVPETEFRLDGIMGEIVQREKRGPIVVLSLPGRRTVGADASKESSAILALGKLENQFRH